ncbi:MAG: AAA family ATPase [Leptolyngbya sp.]|nr:AAA family ATPase [Candidatus Melainabacteria bacterium]
MKRIILLIGVPGSGKTTLAGKIAEKGFTIMNADSIRLELYGDAKEQGDPKEVFALFFERMEKMMETGTDLIIDNTNLNHKHRIPILERAKKYDYQDVQLWLLDVPLDVCVQRNSKRERVVDKEIVANMHSELNRNGRPKRDEGKLVLIRQGKDENDYRFFVPN